MELTNVSCLFRVRFGIIRGELLFQAGLKFAEAQSAARIQATQTVADAKRKRQDAIETIAERAGIQLPERPVTRPGSSSERTEDVDAFKSRMLNQVKLSIPEQHRGIAAGKIADSCIQEMVSNVDLGQGKGNQLDLNIRLAAGLAKQFGMSRADLEKMLDSVKDPKNKEATQYFQDSVLSSFDGSKKDKAAEDIEQPRRASG